MIKVAIVGCGPRGLSSIEQLVRNLIFKRHSKEWKLLLFDSASCPGAGTVWDMEQSSANWINISLRALEDLQGREPMILNEVIIPAFPKFTQWLSDEYKIITKGNKDLFPHRSKMGEYLHKRFISIITVLEKVGLIEYHQKHITDLIVRKDHLVLKDQHNERYTVKHCLITVGHQETKPDKQLQSWLEHEKVHKAKLFINAYDSELNSEIASKNIVGLRGFGLGMIDVIRELTVERGAFFEEKEDSIFLRYVESKNSVKLIIPFSLNGLPPVPKPMNRQIDCRFKPGQETIDIFTNNLVQALENDEPVKSIGFLVDAFCEVVYDVFCDYNSLNNKELEKIAKQWLTEPSKNHKSYLDYSMDKLEYMKETCLFSAGMKEPTIDYCLGQLWRHLQPIMYRLFSHSSLDDSLMTEIIEMDEGTKRFSFGPPLESVLQLVALTEAGVIDLRLVDDPEITCIKDGWKMTKDTFSEECDVMINTVVSPPKVKNINEGLIHSLIHDENIQIVSEDLGIKTNEDGTVESRNKVLGNRLTMLGRNCKGSVLGVDAILECFGPRIEKWADAMSDRMIGE